MCAIKYRHGFVQAKQEAGLTATYGGVATQRVHVRELSYVGHGDRCRKAHINLVEPAQEHRRPGMRWREAGPSKP